MIKYLNFNLKMAYIVTIIDYVHDGKGHKFDFRTFNNKMDAITEAFRVIGSLLADHNMKSLYVTDDTQNLDATAKIEYFKNNVLPVDKTIDDVVINQKLISIAYDEASDSNLFNFIENGEHVIIPYKNSNYHEHCVVFIKHTNYPERYTQNVSDFLNCEVNINKFGIPY